MRLAIISSILVNVAVGSTCDQNAICVKLNGGGYCKTWQNPPVCIGGNQSCSCSTVSSTTTTTKPATTTTKAGTTVATTAGTGATTTKPASTTITPISSSTLGTVNVPATGCGATSVPIVIWTEIPGLHDLAAWQGFYAKQAQYATKNCLNGKVSKILVRVLNPESASASGPIWWPPQSSPLYTHLISKLPAGVQLIFYPHIGYSGDVTKWKAQSSTGDMLDGIYAFASKWNAFLASVGAPAQFTGVSFDREEFTIAGFDLTATNVAAMKAKYPVMKEVGMAVGYVSVGRVMTYGPFVDFFYVEFYDLWTTATGALDGTASSPFMTHKNDPQAIIDLLFTVTTAYQRDQYAKYGKQIYAMWSQQDKGAACAFPDTASGPCGANYEFGSWSPAAMNQFLTKVSGVYPFNQIKGHAFFQFSYTPLSWM